MNMKGRMPVKSTVALAVAGVPGSSHSVAQDAGGDVGWKYVTASYIWGASVDGTAGNEHGEVDVSADFSDLVEFADIDGAISTPGIGDSSSHESWTDATVVFDILLNSFGDGKVSFGRISGRETRI